LFIPTLAISLQVWNCFTWTYLKISWTTENGWRNALGWMDGRKSAFSHNILEYV